MLHALPEDLRSAGDACRGRFFDYAKRGLFGGAQFFEHLDDGTDAGRLGSREFAAFGRGLNLDANGPRSSVIGELISPALRTSGLPIGVDVEVMIP